MERLSERHKYNGKDHISVDSKKYGISCSNFCTSCEKADCDDIRKSLFKLAEYEDFEEIFRSKMTDAACELLSDKEEFAKWLDRNKWIAKKCDEYAREEEQGRFLKLPFVIGDKVYKIIPHLIRGNYVEEFFVTHIDIDNNPQICFAYRKGEHWDFANVEDIGKEFFLTYQEAAAKLAEMEGKK